MILVPIVTFLKSPLFKYLVVIAIVAGILFGAYRKGAYDVQVKWDLDKERHKKEVAELKSDQGEKTIEVVTKYVDRIKVVKEKGETIVQYVDRWITAEDNANCKLPPSFIMLHNSAVSNTQVKPPIAKND